MESMTVGRIELSDAFNRAILQETNLANKGEPLKGRGVLAFYLDVDHLEYVEYEFEGQHGDEAVPERCRTVLKFYLRV